MQQPERKQALQFLLRFVLLFTVFLMPLPWLADVYTTAFDAAANCVVCPIMNQLSDVSMVFEPPESIARQGSWKGMLRVENDTTRQVAYTKLDVRTFSYRPLVTYLALALAAPLLGTRRKALILGGGALLMIAFGMFFSSLPILSRFSATGALGVAPGLAARTAYEAIATPVMVYAVPLIVFWALALIRRGRVRGT